MSFREKDLRQHIEEIYTMEDLFYYGTIIPFSPVIQLWTGPDNCYY